MVELKGYKVNKLEMENTVKPGTQLKLQNQVKYNVNYMDSVHKCVGLLSFRITDADMIPFEIRLEMVAEFSFDEADEKPDIHTASFDQLFPFVRMLVNQITGISGMPGLMIPMMKLNKNTVNVGRPEDNEASPLN